jgi:ATP-dependent Clp protease protease subunit
VANDRIDDVHSRLLKRRVVLVGGPIDDTVANLVMAQMLFLQHESKTAPIDLHINSPGGSVVASLAVYDTIRFVKNEVATWVTGRAEGTALLLACAGTPGRRHALRHARLRFTELRGQAREASAAELEIQREEIARLRTVLQESFAKHTGQPIARVARSMEDEESLDAEGARAYGLVDHVVDREPRG